MKKQTTQIKSKKMQIRPKKNSSSLTPATVNMDSKKRVCLTRVLSKDEKENFDAFRIYREGGKIILEPVVQVPDQDHWIYKDPKALASLIKGIKDAEDGRLYDLGSLNVF